MQEIIIVCAGGYGLEIYTEVKEINRVRKTEVYRILGFLSDVPVELKSKGIEEPILGTIKGWKPLGNEKYIIGLSKPEYKKKIAEELKENGAQFISIVSQYAYVLKDVQIGEGCFISAGARVNCGAELGDFVNVNGSMIYSGAKIGNYSTTTGFTVVEEAIVEEGVFIGSKAVITQGCRVGAWANVSAGSVVINDIRSGSTVFGMPAQEMT